MAALDILWRRWAAAAVEVDEPFRFLMFVC